MARESTIQVLYGNAATTAPNDLSDGEFAFAHGNDKLFIGSNGDNTAVWVGAEILDEDTFTSDSDTSLATQQSIKAYVDSAIGASAGVVSIEGLNGAIDLDANTGITLSTSGGDTITFSGTDATTSAKGVASFSSDNFAVASGAVTIKDGGVANAELANSSLTVTAGDGLATTSASISLGGSATLSVNVDDTTLEIATDALQVKALGIDTAQLAADAVDGTKIADDSIDSEHYVDGSIDNIHLANSSVTITAGDGLATTSASISLGSSATLSVNVDDSTIEINSDSLRVKDGGITNAKLANSSFVISDGAGNTSDISLGNTLTLQGTTNEVSVVESAGTVTIGLPDDVTIAGNLTVNGTVTTIDTNNLVVEDSLIKLARGNTGANSVDIGFYGVYDPSGTDLYTGFMWDADDQKYRLFDSLQDEPTTTVDVDTGTGYAVATLVANISGGSF